MLIFFRALIVFVQSHFKPLERTAGELFRPVLLCQPPCARPLALRNEALPSLTYQVGQNEKNVNQCNSGRRVAHGDGRWPTPL